MDVAWDFSTGHYSTKVGVLDSGIQWYHEDLIDGSNVIPDFSRVKGGYDYAYQSKKNIFLKSADSYGHGTKMAGIIGAIRNNAQGVASIAGGNMNPNPSPGFFFQDGVQLFNLNVCDKGTSTISMSYLTDACLEGATNTSIKTKNGFGFGLNVMNMSLGVQVGAGNIPQGSQTLEQVMYFAFLNNVVMSASSGNDNSSLPHIPSSFNDEWVMRVGASNEFGERALISNTANALDFIAPGENKIIATLDYANSNGYITAGGTSSAAAHVSGVSALMIGYMVGQPLRPNDLAPEDIENLLQKFADDKEAKGYDDNTGFGKINAGNTLKGIKFPRFQVKHYSKGFVEQDVQLLSSNQTITFCSPITYCSSQNITYTGDAYEIVLKIDIKQPKGRKILDVWALNSMSDVFDGYNTSPFKNKLTLVSWDQNTAIVKGMIYKYKTATTTTKGVNIPHPFVKWVFPNELLDIFSEHKVTITVYSEDASVTNTLSTSIDETHLRISPNPSNGNFNILFGLLKDTKMGIQVTDLSGKTVYAEPLKDELEGHKEISLDLNHLNNGMYLCNIITNEGIITRKITIIH